MIQEIKNWLFARGPDSDIVQAALKWQAYSKGLSLRFNDSVVTLSNSKRRMLLHRRHFVYIPLLLNGFDTSFNFFEPIFVDGIETLDFTVPTIRKYKESGLSLYCASFPEEDGMETYTRHHQIAPGETIWDVGANSGFTTCHFSHAVTQSGRVIAWEPDPLNFECLLRNIEMHSLTNVTPTKKALSGLTGTAMFDMDGSTGAGLSNHLVYSSAQTRSVVETVSFKDACDLYGTPSLVKMDIEGGELEVIRGALPFLKQQPKIDFSIETHRMRNGQSTEIDLAEMFKAAAYRVTISKDKYGQNFLWAGK